MTEQLHGQLEVFGFADLLQWMELNRRSGRLTLEQGRDRRLLDWRDGQIVYVSGSLPRHRLGVHLLRSGALSSATLYTLLARNFTSRETLSRLILDGGHDTLDGLSLRVEELARRLLFEMFEWQAARFGYDPDYRVQPILRIGLSLRGQALAFHGAKKLDDTQRRRSGSDTEELEAPRQFFERAETEDLFWEVLDRVGLPLGPEEGHQAHARFLEFARNTRDRAAGPVLMHPVHEDTADLLLEILRKSPCDVEGIIPVAALDPFLTLDLLTLANALSIDRDNAVGTVPDAIQRIGPQAAITLIDRLSGVDFPRVSESDSAFRLLRRASVAAAIAAGRYAERYSITRERGYTLGLLHGIAYAELFEVLHEVELPSGPFRAGILDVYRPPLGRALAEKWGLPLDFQSLLADDGSEPSASAALIRTARAAVPSCAIGAVGVEPLESVWSEEIAHEVSVVFEFLGLERSS